MKAPDILKAAAGHMEDRAATYDKPEGERSMAATVSAFRCVTGHALTEEQGWLFMQLLKAVRSQQGDYRADSYEDGAAYASLAGEAAYRERVTQALGCSDPYADTHLDLRMDTIARNGNDGEHYAEARKYKIGDRVSIQGETYRIISQPNEDMTDPANWRAGDLVECVTDQNRDISAGSLYPIVSLDRDGDPVIKDDAGEVAPWHYGAFRFHSRPSQVNDAEMSGIWHHWTSGNAAPPPCDDKSELEIQYEGCDNTIRTFGIHVMWDRNLRYRML